MGESNKEQKFIETFFKGSFIHFLSGRDINRGCAVQRRRVGLQRDPPRLPQQDRRGGEPEAGPGVLSVCRLHAEENYCEVRPFIIHTLFLQEHRSVQKSNKNMTNH